MNKITISLYLAVEFLFAAACTPSASSAPAIGQNPPGSQSVDPLIPIKDRTASKEFYLDMRESNGSDSQHDSHISLAKSRGFQGAYQALASIYIGSMTPDKIEMSFPIPPEVEIVNDVEIKVIFGCHSLEGYDFDIIVADFQGLRLETVRGMPRGSLTVRDRIAEAFDFCGRRPLNVTIAFVTKTGDLVAYEQVRIFSTRTDIH